MKSTHSVTKYSIQRLLIKLCVVVHCRYIIYNKLTLIAKKLKTKKEKEKNKEPGISKLKNEYEPKLFVKCCIIFPSFNKDDVEKIERKKKKQGKGKERKKMRVRSKRTIKVRKRKKMCV